MFFAHYSQGLNAVNGLSVRTGIIASTDTPGTAQDVTAFNGQVFLAGVAGDFLYVLTSTTLHTLALNNQPLGVVHSAASPVSVSHQRLSVAGGYLYAVQNQGVNTFSLTNPAAPLLLSAGNTTELGWRHFVPTGSGFAVTADGPNLLLDDQNEISLYNLNNPTNTQTFITAFRLPALPMPFQSTMD